MTHKPTVKINKKVRAQIARKGLKKEKLILELKKAMKRKGILSVDYSYKKDSYIQINGEWWREVTSQLPIPTQSDNVAVYRGKWYMKDNGGAVSG